MSARVLNPMLMSDMSRGGLAGNSGRVVPTKAELAPVRRDLFGPVDHAANRALAERELRAQSRIDADRWGFDFQLGLPRCDARYAWEVVTPTDVVPEPYALRGMPYLRKHAPGTPRKMNNTSPKFLRNIGGITTGIIQTEIDTETTTGTTTTSSISVKNNTSSSIITTTTTTTTTTTMGINNNNNIDNHTDIVIDNTRNSEMTPPQELRVPDISNRNCETTPEEVPREINKILKQSIVEDPTTPVLPIGARKQSIITDFMKSRKRTLKGSSPKSIVEPPEKISRNAGQIRS